MLAASVDHTIYLPINLLPDIATPLANISRKMDQVETKETEIAGFGFNRDRGSLLINTLDGHVIERRPDGSTTESAGGRVLRAEDAKGNYYMYEWKYEGLSVQGDDGRT